tara:strand:+ start:380 stop:712 length:333 start_codon:yes stop_codon:yes gene_type:complete
MIEETLKSGRKVMIREMSIDDIDTCKDMLQVVFKDGQAQTVYGLNKQKTHWIRKGLGGGDFSGWNTPGKGNAPDHVIKQLSDLEKDELVALIQEKQALGEENPSSSSSMS